MCLGEYGCLVSGFILIWYIDYYLMSFADYDWSTGNDFSYVLWVLISLSIVREGRDLGECIIFLFYL